MSPSIPKMMRLDPRNMSIMLRLRYMLFKDFEVRTSVFFKQLIMMDNVRARRKEMWRRRSLDAKGGAKPMTAA